ncbi:MAG TPA: Flp pilus assembly protein CpaB [Methylophilus sp.]
MGNTRGLLMLIIAIAAAAGAVVMASKWLAARSTNVNKIVVAAQEVNLGQKLTPEMLKLVDWPAGSMPPDAFKELLALDGRVTKTSLQVGEPIMASKLAPMGTQGGLSAVIAEGKRAITVRVNDVVGVAGFALPGNFVDIIVNTDQEEGSGNDMKKQDISKIVLEHILVLAVAQEVGRDATKPKVVNAVTLEVTPEQAEMIDLARSVGNLYLVLRNQSDPASMPTAGITKDILLDMKTPMPAAAVAPMAQPKVIYKTKTVAKAKPAPVIEKKCTRVMTGVTESLECF